MAIIVPNATKTIVYIAKNVKIVIYKYLFFYHIINIFLNFKEKIQKTRDCNLTIYVSQ